MKARITPTLGQPFHIWWDGAAVTDGHCTLSQQAVAILNGELDLPRGIKHDSGTDGHAWESGHLRSRDDLLLIVGSLVDRLDGVSRVDLVSEA